MLLLGLKGRKVVVNTTAGDTFNGTVVSAGPFMLRLSGVTIYESTGASGPADGFVRIPRSLVTWIQEL